MSAPPPHLFERAIDLALEEMAAIAEGLGGLKDEYRWTYEATHFPTVSDRGGSRQPEPEQPEVATASGTDVPGYSPHPGGPTAAVAVYKMAMRSHLEHAFKAVAETPNAWKSLIGKVSLRDRETSIVAEPLRYPRVASNADLEEAREARARRRQRGEDYAQAPIPRAE